MYFIGNLYCQLPLFTSYTKWQNFPRLYYNLTSDIYSPETFLENKLVEGNQRMKKNIIENFFKI